VDQVAVVEIGREALWVVLKMAGPIMIVGLFVGLVIALFQALTTIQELTLTFVPKILAIFIAIIVFLPFMITTLIEYSTRLFERMGSVG